MHQPVLVDADVHEHAEVDDVAHRAGELHAGLQILHLQHVGAQNGAGQLVPGVPAGLHQLAHDVPQGGHSHAARLRGLLLAVGGHPLPQPVQAAGLHVGQAVAAQGEQGLRRAVALRVDAGVIQHVAALRHPQEADALLKGLRPQLGHLEHPLPGGEGSVLLPVLDDVPGGGVVQPRHVGQQGGGGGVEIHPHRVDAVLHHAGEGLVQPGLGHVVLVLAHADALGVDLHQLGQGILEPPGDGHGASQVHVVVGELLRGQLGGGVDRGPRLVDDHVADAAAQPLDELHRHLLGLPAGGAVADGDVGHAVAADELCQRVDGLLLLPLAERGVDHRRVQHLAGGVHHRHLAAVAVAGVKPHGDKALHRRLHQQGLEVEAEHFDGPLVGLLSEQAAHLPFHRGEDQPVVGVLGGGADEGHGGGAGVQHRPADGDQGRLALHLHAHLEHALPLSAVDGQHLVALYPVQGGAEGVVEPVDGVLRLLGRGGGDQISLFPHQLPQALADVRVVGDALGDDVAGSLEGVLRRLHPLLRVDKGPGGLLRRRAVRGLGEEQLGQRLQPLFAGHGGAGAALLLIGAVEILHLRQGGGGVDGGGELLRQLALALDGGLDLLPPLVQIAQVLQPVGQGAQGGIVHGPVELLAVAGDEGDGVALVNEAHHVLHVGLAPAQLPGQYLNDCVHISAPCGIGIRLFYANLTGKSSGFPCAFPSEAVE